MGSKETQTCERYAIIVFVTYATFLYKVVIVANVAQFSCMSMAWDSSPPLSPCVIEAVSLPMGTRRTWYEILDLQLLLPKDEVY